MSSHAFTENQPVEQPAVDLASLGTRGWVSFKVSVPRESDLPERLLALAASLGTPALTRSCGSLCDTLLPTMADAAKPRSLSKLHALGEFPLHIDTAHWLTPCRYVMLACASPGSGSRPTLLMDARKIPLSKNEVSLLHSAPFRVTNGRNSFFSTILAQARPFVRFDPGCMTATTPDGVEALDVLSRHNWPDYVDHVQWDSGTVLIMDNWRILHGRGLTERPDSNRKLFRISIR